MNDSSVFTWVGRLHRSFAIDILKIKGLREKFSHLSISRAGTWQGLYWSSLMIFFRFSFFFDNGLICKQFFFQFIQRNKKIKKIAWSFERMFSPCSPCTEYSCHANFSPTAKAKQLRVKRYESLHHTYCSVRTSTTNSTCSSQP